MDTRKQIIKAMFELLSKYPIEKITGDMIAEQSGLSRTSFYRKFQDKYHLMTMCYADYADKIVKNEIEGGNWAAAIEKSLQFIYNNKKVFENLFKSEGPDSFSKYLYADFLRKLKENYMKFKGIGKLTLYEDYIIKLYISGIVHCEEEWVKNGMNLSPNELTQIIMDAMPDTIKNVVAKTFE